MRISNINSLDKIAQTKCSHTLTLTIQWLTVRDKANMTVAGGVFDATELHPVYSVA